MRPDTFNSEASSAARSLRTNYINPVAAGAGWTIKSVTLNGADITDTPLDIPSVGDISGIEIALTDTLTVPLGNCDERST